MRNRLFGLLAVWVGSLSTPAGAYETPTHAQITRFAGERSIVDETLKARLGLADGLDTRIQGERLTNWLMRGARTEDSFLRFLNHFHNPLADWSAAGLGSLGRRPSSGGRTPAHRAGRGQDVRIAYFGADTAGPL